MNPSVCSPNITVMNAMSIGRMLVFIASLSLLGRQYLNQKKKNIHKENVYLSTEVSSNICYLKCMAMGVYTRRGQGGAGTVPHQNFANVTIRAKIGRNSGRIRANIRATFFVFCCCLLVKILLSGILGACMYPYADTGIEYRKFWSRKKKVHELSSTPSSARLSGLARIRA